MLLQVFRIIETMRQADHTPGNIFAQFSSGFYAAPWPDNLDGCVVFDAQTSRIGGVDQEVPGNEVFKAATR